MGLSTKSVHETTSEAMLIETSELTSTADPSTEYTEKLTRESTSEPTTEKTSKAVLTTVPSTESTGEPVAESSQPVSTMGPSTKSVYETTPEAILIKTSELVSTVGPSIQYTEELTRETASEGTEIETSEPTSTVGTSTESTEKTLRETTSRAVVDKTSAPDENQTTEKPMIDTTSVFGIQTSVLTMFPSTKYTENIMRKVTSESTVDETSEQASTVGFSYKSTEKPPRETSKSVCTVVCRKQKRKAQRL